MSNLPGDHKTYQTILFDLDDTLLVNPIDRFMGVYLDQLAEYARPLFADKYFFWATLMRCTQQMVANADQSRTNREVFWSCFSDQTRADAAEAEAFFAAFYRDLFPRLQVVTNTKPAAAPLVHLCLAQARAVVIATNPLFPLSAIQHRLAWAGVPADRNPFSLITSYENMHTAKPHCAYYDEILGIVGASPETAIMIGDEWRNDIVPARQAGLDVFWITEDGADPPDPTMLVGWGPLADVQAHLFPTVTTAS